MHQVCVIFATSALCVLRNTLQLGLSTMTPKCPNIPDHVAYAKIHCCHIPSKVENIEYKARWRRHTGRDVSYEYKYYVSSTELERVNVIKDLVVLFD